MKHITLGIFEKVPVYGKKMAGYISGYDQSPFLVRLYLEHPAKLPETGLDVCMVTSSLWPEYQAMMEGMQVLILDENGTLKKMAGCRLAYKYQSAAAIYAILLDLCMEAGKWQPAASGKTKKDFEVAALYTPVRDEAVARKVCGFLSDLSSQKEILCLSLEPVYTGPDGEEEKEPGTLSDVIYYLKQEKQNLGSRTQVMARRPGFDEIRPAAFINELAELGADEWQRLMTALQEETTYESVILDVGAGAMWPAAAGCLGKMIILRRDNPWEARIASRFRKTLDLMAGNTIFSVEEMIGGIDDDLVP